MNAPIQQIPDPDLGSLLNARSRDTSANLNCHQVGVIVSFDPDKQTASVKIAMNKQVVDYSKNPPAFNYLPYPVLTDCPVFMPAGGTGRLTFPIQPGDPCIIIFNDRDLDNWFSGGASTPPNSSRIHDLSDGIVLVGIRNVALAYGDYNTASAELRYKDGALLLADKVALNGKDSDLKTMFAKVIAALTALDAKTGPSAATQIAAVTTESGKLFQ